MPRMVRRHPYPRLSPFYFGTPLCRPRHLFAGGPRFEGQFNQATPNFIRSWRMIKTPSNTPQHE
jgi:hypothetical protein